MGIAGRNLGNFVPNWKAFFDFAVGDRFQYEKETLVGGSGDIESQTLRIDQYTVTDRRETDTQIVYEIEGISRVVEREFGNNYIHASHVFVLHDSLVIRANRHEWEHVNSIPFMETERPHRVGMPPGELHTVLALDSLPPAESCDLLLTYELDAESGRLHVHSQYWTTYDGVTAILQQGICGSLMPGEATYVEGLGLYETPRPRLLPWNRAHGLDEGRHHNRRLPGYRANGGRGLRRRAARPLSMFIRTRRMRSSGSPIGVRARPR